MTTLVEFGGVLLELPDGWLDITEDLPEGSSATLAKAAGPGAFQISSARYAGGKLPDVQHSDLEKLLEDFASTRGLVAPKSMVRGRGRSAFVTADFSSAREVVRVWYVSDGRSVALVTYVATETSDPAIAGEVAEASAMVESLAFP